MDRALDVELKVLMIIRDSPVPMGAGAIRRELERRGMFLSEATVGRLLTDLEVRGMLRKDRNKGRHMTELGLNRLALLERNSLSSAMAMGLVDSILSREGERILELLEARRAVEQEVARLAALRGTPDQISALWSSVECMEEAVRMGNPVWEEDSRFHRMLAMASGNRLLVSVVELLRQNPFEARELEMVRRKAGRLSNSDHRSIMEAVSNHDPDEAEMAMRRHIDNLVADCRALIGTKTAESGS
ncbi:MAG: FCD domain-containing protein [Thermanaerothrix sp.]|nr:FCD domain-containing protein [Thermanaerothrix sp.]